MDAGSKILEDLKQRGCELVKEWANDVQNEDLHIEFKRKTNPDGAKPDPEDTKNYAKALGQIKTKTAPYRHRVCALSQSR